MARAPLLQLADISLTFGGDPVFADLGLVVQPADRVALVGRNGSGKSTLLKLMAGLVEPDSGSLTVAPATTVGYMEQDPDLSGFETLGDFALDGLDDGLSYKVEIEAEGLKLDLSTTIAAASGGERRRAALVKLLAQEPNLMLFDEPTNHLDVEAIGWLERRLLETRAAFVVISHDRAFLNTLTRATLWIDRGAVRRQEKGFSAFEAWRDKTWQEEDLSRHKMDRKIKAEARWAVEGISARRKRNMGRVRALQDLRTERSAMIRRQGTADMALASGQKSGKRVIEARAIEKSFDGRRILAPFDLRVMRGDRVAFVGPNGVGKTTLLKMLTGMMPPDAGTVTLGHNIKMAIFDQNRSQLDPKQSLWDALVNDPDMRVSGRSDQVMVRGTPKHVVGYLKDFLFEEHQARAPVRSLSGGERARLLLARIMARESNVLVLDEPTNDLDVETLDLLQDVLGDYDGTVLLVSHDRDFIDRVASTTIAMEGDARATIYAGGWSDYQVQRSQQDAVKPANAATSRKSDAVRNTGSRTTTTAKLSFKEQYRLDTLPDEISKFEAEISKLEQFLSDPDLYTASPEKFQKASAALIERQTLLAAAEEEWLTLEERTTILE